MPRVVKRSASQAVKSGPSRRGPTDYRMLRFFLDHGFYKIESCNAYAPCEHLGHAHHGALLLCEKCDGAMKSRTSNSTVCCGKRPPAPALPGTGKWSSSWACAGTA